MSKMSFSFSLNVMLSMSNTLKIDQIHLRAVMLCMSKMLKMSKMGKEHTHVKDVRDGKRTYTNIFAHNFLNIQLIFNPQKVLRS